MLQKICNSLRNKVLTLIQNKITRIDLQVKLSLMVTTDYPTVPVDAVFLFGRAKGDDNDALFDVVSKLHLFSLAQTVLINGSEGEKQGGTIPCESWAGRTNWISQLTAHDIPLFHINTFPPAYNTAEESKYMVEHAKECGWKSAVIVAQPHQLLRCLAMTLYAMKEQQYMMKIYCACPRSVDWNEPCAGSQGAFDMPRSEHIGMEYSKVQSYRFNIATLPEVYKYLTNR